MNGLVIALIMLVASAALIAINLPAILRVMGLHRHYTIPAFHLPGKRVLVVCTSHATLDPTGKATGAFGSEFTVPYYAFIDAGMTVDMASIKGGAIPLQPPSWNWPLACAAKRIDGKLLVKGRRVTGVTNDQINTFGIAVTPKHPEEELRRAGAIFECQHAWRDPFATHTTIDGNLITGQNQNSGYETAHRILEKLATTHNR